MILFYYIQFYFTQFNTKKSLKAIFLIKCLKQQQEQELLRAVDRFSLTEIGKKQKYTNAKTVWVCLRPSPYLRKTLKGWLHSIIVENARKFRESAPNQILIFGKPPPRVGALENVGFFKFKRVYWASTCRN